MVKFNAKLTKILKKANNVSLFKEGHIYYVSQGHFVFRTGDTEALLQMGLIDFSGEIRESKDVLKKIMDDWYKADLTLRDSGLVFNERERIVRVLKGEEFLTLVNQEYFEIFKDCDFRSGTTPFSCVYSFKDDILAGCILPLVGGNTLQEISSLSVLAKETLEAYPRSDSAQYSKRVKKV